MKTPRLASPIAFLALVLFCLAPSLAHAYTRTRAFRVAKPQLRHGQTFRVHATAHARGRLSPRSDHTAKHTQKREIDPQPLRRTRSRSRRARAPEHSVAEVQVQPKVLGRKQAPDPLLIVARPASENQATGISQPPDFNDVSNSAAIPVPVIALIRPTTDRPQLAPIEEAASTPEILPSLYNKRGRLIMPPAMKGSREILLHQNEVADHDGLKRIQDDDDLESMRRGAFLVAVPVNAGMQVDERLPDNRRYCRPWTALFLENLARAHYARFHTPLQVNSAVRTVSFQQHLLHINGNAAPAEGETASPHLTGQAIDLAKRGLSLSEIAWMRGYLLPLVQEGKIDVEEEFQQSCFHVSVYKKYVPISAPRRLIATTHRDSPAALAIAVQ